MFTKKILHTQQLVIIFTLLALTFSSIGVTPVYAATIVVTSSANNGPGTLRQAIASAASGSTINFDPSLSGATIYLASELVIPTTLTIDGSALAARITLSGDSDADDSGDVRVIRVTTLTGTVILDSLIITRGYSLGGEVGGGINSSALLYLKNTLVSGNFSDGAGGGIYNGYYLNLDNSTVSDNFAVTSGGGIYNDGGAIYATNSTVSSNHATNEGGGIFSSGTLSITNSMVSGNSANGLGGGIYTVTLSLTVLNSTISGNVSYNGGTGAGGIYVGSGTASITNSTVSGNSAVGNSGNGGGIFNSGALIVTNSTIYGNSAKGSGGGIYNHTGATSNAYNASIVFNIADADDNGGSAGGVYNLGTFNMRNTLIAGNYGTGAAPIYDDCGGTIRSYGRDMIGAPYANYSGSCNVFQVEGASTQLNDLSLLGSLQNNGGPTKTVALLAGSNAINGGDPVYGCTDVNGDPILTDQRGGDRALTHCDIGAYEVLPDTQIDTYPSSPTLSATAAFTFSSADSSATFECSLDDAVYTACASGQSYASLISGTHIFAVRAKDADGNADITPALFEWKIQKQVVLNGGFETYSQKSPRIPTSWKAVKFIAPDGKSTARKSGKYAVQIAGNGVRKTLTQTVTVSGVLGDPINFSFYVKGASAPKTGICQATVTFFNSSAKVGTPKVFKCPNKKLTFNWTQVKSVSFTAPGTFSHITVIFTVKKSAGTLWFDNVSLVK